MSQYLLIFMAIFHTISMITLCNNPFYISENVLNALNVWGTSLEIALTLISLFLDMTRTE